MWLREINRVRNQYAHSTVTKKQKRFRTLQIKGKSIILLHTHIKITNMKVNKVRKIF